MRNVVALAGLIAVTLLPQTASAQQRAAYEAMVAKNREREIKFSGDLNPMVEEHGDKWESIQFSGKTNSADWKCPFHFRESAAK